MGFPRQLSLSLARYVAQHKLQRWERFPLVLMLEVTFRCNLACAGCGRIREAREASYRDLTVDECLAAAEEVGTPVVSVSGGEPLLHPRIEEIVDGLTARKRFVHLCTNGLNLAGALPRFQPSPYLGFVVHIDGLAGTHDRITGRDGVFETAIAALCSAREAGFRVHTNTTIYQGTQPEELDGLFALLSQLRVDSLMVTPAFSYESVDADIFLTRQEAAAIFQDLQARGGRYRYYNTSLYMDFLAGRRELTCQPWSTLTRNPKGWKQPCYLLTDGYCASYRELMERTPWERYGVGKDPRCTHCMMHSGFEAAAVAEATRSPAALWRLMRWNTS